MDFILFELEQRRNLEEEYNNYRNNMIGLLKHSKFIQSGGTIGEYITINISIDSWEVCEGDIDCAKVLMIYDFSEIKNLYPNASIKITESQNRGTYGTVYGLIKVYF